MKPPLLDYQSALPVATGAGRRIAAMLALVLACAAHMTAMYLLFRGLDDGLRFYMPALIAFGVDASILQFGCAPHRRTAWMPLHAILAAVLTLLSSYGGLGVAGNVFGI